MINLKSFGTSFELYRNDNRELLPYVLPFYRSGQQDPLLGSAPRNSRDMLDVIGRYMSVDPPRRENPDDENTPFIRQDPFFCPSDKDPESAASTGISYEYFAGYIMFLRETFGGDLNAQATVSKFYTLNSRYPVMSDSKDFHKGLNSRVGKNALYFGDWRVDWLEETGNSFEAIRSQVPNMPQVPPGGTP
jgi:hypothetical protein